MLQNIKSNTNLLVQQIQVPRVQGATATVPVVSAETGKLTDAASIEVGLQCLLVAKWKCDYYIKYYNNRFKYPS